MFVLDTNVVSELRRPRPHRDVLAWFGSVPIHDVHISAVTIGQLQVGVERLREHDDERATTLEDWLEGLLVRASILPMDTACFRCWARLMLGRSRDVLEDAMIAATAIVHDFTVVTRNTKDFVDFGVPLLDPFAPQ